MKNKVNTNKVNSFQTKKNPKNKVGLSNIPDKYLIKEIERRGFEVLKWDDEAVWIDENKALSR
jgi:hypothetical protein